MSGYEELLKRFAEAAANDIKALLPKAEADMDLSEEDKGKLALFLSLAWRDGAMAGQSEVIAQAIEQGAVVDFEMIRAPADDS